MNFFENQRQAQKTSRKLLAIFYLIVTAVTLLITIGTLFLIEYDEVNPYEHSSEHILNYFFKSEVLMLAASIFFIVAGVMILKSLFTINELKLNPSSICHKLEAKLIPLDTKEPLERRYLNLVEEMSIASSVPMPAVYLLNEEAINAFAVGFDINSAAVCITTGCLKKLNRDELQAVIAHEFSHILNGDMKINLKLIGMLSGLLLVFQIGLRILNSSGRRSSSSKGNNGALIALGIMAIGGIGYLGGLLLKAAISRQREYLADASSVQFTRNPLGISGALKKIYLDETKGQLSHPEAQIAAHMFLVEGVKSFFSLSTHPPLLQRIKAVEPHFDEVRFKELDSAQLLSEMAKKEQSDEKEKNKQDQHSRLDRAHDQIEKLLPIMMALGSQAPEESKTSLLDRIRDFSLKVLKRDEDPFKSMSLEDLEVVLEKLAGSLRSLSQVEKASLLSDLTKQVEADGQMSFLEFLVLGYLKPILSTISLKDKRLKQNKVEGYKHLVFSLYYYLGSDNENFESSFKPLPQADFNLKQVFVALEALRFAQIKVKEELIKGLKEIAQIDGQINTHERIIFSLISQSLGMPGKLLLEDMVASV